MAAAIRLSQQHSCSFDHLVGAPGKGEWEGDAKGFGCLQIDQQLDFRDLLDRQIGRFVALEDASGIDTGLTVGFHKAASVAHQPAGESEVARLVDRGQRVAEGEGGELFTMSGKEGIGGDDQTAYPQLEQGCEHRIEVSCTDGAATPAQALLPADFSIVNRRWDWSG